ncbi:MAG: hypothetical protein NXI24_06700 [bacterium]|nr:hypothetical protein [bacterium]
MSAKAPASADVTALTHRLSQCPPVFLRAPLHLKNKAREGEIHAGAVVSDLLIALNHEALSASEAESFVLRHSAVNLILLQLELLAAHLLFAPALREIEIDAERLRAFFLEHKLKALAELKPNPANFVSDAERREELVRLLLDALALQPAGEKPAESRDRLQTLDSVERERVIAASRAAQKRAQELREAMARKRAEEAASKMTRE